MNKTQLIDQIAAKTGDKKAAAVAIEAFVDAVTAAVAAGEKVSINGFGSFERVTRAARNFYNPATGEHGTVPATHVPKFRVGSAFRAAAKSHHA